MKHSVKKIIVKNNSYKTLARFTKESKCYENQKPKEELQPIHRNTRIERALQLCQSMLYSRRNFNYPWNTWEPWRLFYVLLNSEYFRKLYATSEQTSFHNSYEKETVNILHLFLMSYIREIWRDIKPTVTPEYTFIMKLMVKVQSLRKTWTLKNGRRLETAGDSTRNWMDYWEWI